MLRILPTAIVLNCLLIASLIAQEGQPDMQEMMKKMQAHATPGEQHKLLSRMVGIWKTEMRVMGGAATEGSAEFQWIMGDRYVQQTFKGNMMGQPYEGMGLFGYDNYKKKFTSMWIDSLSTTMNYGEGLLDQSGKIISFYGTMDEYLTGEHDKPVKYVLDLSKDDEINFEIHDLAIGRNSMVVSIKFTRGE